MNTPPPDLSSEKEHPYFAWKNQACEGHRAAAAAMRAMIFATGNLSGAKHRPMRPDIRH